MSAHEDHITTPLGDVLVCGLGGSGMAVARYLCERLGGRVRSVTVVGGTSSAEGEGSRELVSAGARVILGTEEVTGSYDLAVVSPGISDKSAFFSAAREHAREVVGEPEFAWRESPRDWIAITGTNGKTTTTTLVRDLLRVGGLDAEAVGNIGTIATGELDGRRGGEWFCAELSSFQLATSSQLHPHVAVLLNITPDHLAWHGTFEAYVAAKERLFANIDDRDLAIISDDDPEAARLSARLVGRGVSVCHLSCRNRPDAERAAYVADDGTLVVRLDGLEYPLVRTDQLNIRGEHNVENALAASAAALFVGVDVAEVRRGLLSFEPLEHRIEPCGELAGIRFVNDSKATNTDATQKALTAFAPGSVVLLLGGHDKGTELEDLSRDACRCARVAVCFGDAGERIAGALAQENGIESAMGGSTCEVLRAEHLSDALDVAVAAARPGEVVLLSPACSSFDEFSGFEERGRVFKELVARRCAEAEER